MEREFLPRLITGLLMLTLNACGGGGGADSTTTGSGGGTPGGPVGPTIQQLEALGKKLFEDTNFSFPPGQSCASCHDAAFAFTDPDQATPVSEGAEPNRFGTRNSPTVMYAASIPTKSSSPIHFGGQFLDGRAATLILQAQQPFLNQVEMNMADKSAVINALRTAAYVDDFTAAYGDDILVVTGDNAVDTANVNLAYDRISQAISRFERSDALSPFNSKFDAVQSAAEVYLPAEQRGEDVFVASNCGRCHSLGPGSVFSNFQYENIGVPSNNANLISSGAMDSNAVLIDNTFVDKGLGGVTLNAADDGKFRVPTLRNVELTAPYMHNGVFDTLLEVVEFYDSRDPALAEVPATVPLGDEIGNLGLTSQQKADLVVFLESLTDR